VKAALETVFRSRSVACAQALRYIYQRAWRWKVSLYFMNAASQNKKADCGNKENISTTLHLK